MRCKTYSNENITDSNIIISQANEDQRKEEAEKAPAISDKIVGVYTRVGKLLKIYKSGKLPKVFKIIPYLNNWEEVSLAMLRSDLN